MSSATLFHDEIDTTTPPAHHSSFAGPMTPTNDDASRTRAVHKPGVIHSTVYLESIKQTVEVEQTQEKKRFTVHVQWKTKSGENQIDLYHGLLLGTRKILVNGLHILSDRNFMDDGSTHQFMIGPTTCVITIRTNNGKFSYHLTMDGNALEQVLY